MPVKKRARFVPDEEARELDRLFLMRDVRRCCRDRELGTLYYTEKWEGTGRRQSLSRLRRQLPLHKGAFERAMSLGFGVAAAVCWFLFFGVVVSLERGRLDVLPGVVLAAVCAAAGALCITLGGMHNG